MKPKLSEEKRKALEKALRLGVQFLWNHGLYTEGMRDELYRLIDEGEYC